MKSNTTTSSCDITSSAWEGSKKPFPVETNIAETVGVFKETIFQRLLFKGIDIKDIDFYKLNIPNKKDKNGMFRIPDLSYDKLLVSMNQVSEYFVYTPQQARTYHHKGFQARHVSIVTEMSSDNNIYNNIPFRKASETHLIIYMRL